MARPHHGLEDFLGFTSTPEWRSAILSAALSFAACHIVVVMTPPLAFDANGMATSLGPQLVHVCAVLLRFVLPLASVAAGLMIHRHRKRLALRR
jgi:hypothetical protein